MCIRSKDKKSRYIKQEIELAIKSRKWQLKLIKEKWIYSLIKVIVERLEIDMLEKSNTKGDNKEVVRVVKWKNKAEIKVL